MRMSPEALSTLDSIRSVPSGAAPILVKPGWTTSKACGKIDRKAPNPAKVAVRKSLNGYNESPLPRAGKC